MKSFSFLLLAVLGGYWFLTHWHLTRYAALRDAGYHLFFRSAICGAVLAAVAYGLLDYATRWSPTVAGWLRRLDDIPHEHAGAALGALALGLVAPPLLNLVTPKLWAARRTARASGDLIEHLFDDALIAQKLVEISLKGGKVYIGFALESACDRSGDTDFAILPVASGYRDPDTHDLEITTNYATVMDECLKGEQRIEGLIDGDFRVVIPLAEILSARIFHPDVYQRMREHNRAVAQDEQPAAHASE